MQLSKCPFEPNKPTIHFTSTVNLEPFKNENGDTTSLPVFTATTSVFLLEAEVTTVGFNTQLNPV